MGIAAFGFLGLNPWPVEVVGPELRDKTKGT